MPADPIQLAQQYWDRAAEHYDEVFPNKVTGHAQRLAVWEELGRVFRPGDHVLELNCGTGIDALHLAESGIRVTACDISPRMIEVARRRLASSRAGELVEFQILPTEGIAALRGPFDGAFSNFSGLNCVEDLPAAARNLAGLLQGGAHLVICVMGRWVPLEVAWHVAHGELRRAFERFRRSSLSRDGRVRVYHYSGAAFERIFAPEFELRRQRGIGIVMPTQQFESWAARSLVAFERLARWDRRLGGLPILRGMGDCSVLDLERVQS